MNKADAYYYRNLELILEKGCLDENPRPRYKDGVPAHSKFITGVFEEYDISKNEFPIPTLRNTAIKTGIKEILWIYQKQREIIKHEGKEFLVSEPQDLINTLNISKEFFNQTYTGLDERISKVLNLIKDSSQEWVSRDKLQEEMSVSRNTIKDYCQKLSNEGLIKGTTGKELNEKLGLKIYDGNKIYYKRCQNGVKKPLIRCEINKLKSFLEEKTSKTLDTFDFNDLSSINNDFDTLKGVKIKVSNPETDSQESVSSGKIDTFSLIPFSKEQIEIDLSFEQLENILKNPLSKSKEECPLW